MPKDIIVRTPCYRLNGHLEFTEETPSGAVIAYYTQVGHIKWQPVAPHIDEALESHKQIINGLLSAGF